MGLPGLNQCIARINVLAQGHNTMTSVRLKPWAPRSRVKHSTTEPLRSLISVVKSWHIISHHWLLLKLHVVHKDLLFTCPLSPSKAWHMFMFVWLSLRVSSAQDKWLITGSNPENPRAKTSPLTQNLINCSYTDCKCVNEQTAISLHNKMLSNVISSLSLCLAQSCLNFHLNAGHSLFLNDKLPTKIHVSSLLMRQFFWASQTNVKHTFWVLKETVLLNTQIKCSYR